MDVLHSGSEKGVYAFHRRLVRRTLVNEGDKGFQDFLPAGPPVAEFIAGQLFERLGECGLQGIERGSVGFLRRFGSPNRLGRRVTENPFSYSCMPMALSRLAMASA